MSAQRLNRESCTTLAELSGKLGKYSEAEEFLSESLKVQDTLSPPDEARVGRRLAELAIAMAGQSKYTEAWPILGRLLPIADRYTGQERLTVKKILEMYSAEYKKLGMQSEALQLEEKLNAL